MPSWVAIVASCFLLFVTSVLLLYAFLDRKFRYWEKKGVKTTTFYDFLCALPKNARTPMHISIMESYKKNGRLFGTCGVFCQLWVADPHLIKQILVKDFHMFRNRMKIDFGNECFQKMLGTLLDDDWKRIRCIMSPTFSSSKMRKMAIMVKDCAENATRHLKKISEKNEEIDMKQFFGSFLVDIIAATAFATKINSLDDPDNEFLANARKMTNRNLSPFTTITVFAAPRLARFLGLTLFPDDAINYYRSVILKILKERENSKVKGYDFLQLMMDAKDGFIETAEDIDEEIGDGRSSQIKYLPKHKTMTLEEVISQCILFFIGGHDTTSSSLSFAAYHLSLNPDCQEKLASEIQETWEKHGKVDFDIVSKMPYLDAVLCETLRIDSPNAMLVREAADDYPLGDTGITIPKGVKAMIPICAMHHDPEWFPDPEKFDPERFMPENKHLITPFTYLPFGEGPRNCIGMRFIMMVMKICLVYILKDFRLVATEETRKPLEFFVGQGAAQAKRVPLKIQKRE